MTPRVLALDTTNEFGSLALLAGESVVEEVPMRSADGFGHIVHDQIARLLGRHGWKLADMDLFAAASGPGSFTGVRIGLAAVKGLAEATAKPAAGVSNLQAMAWFGTAPLRAVVLDARRGEIYGAVYDASLSLVRPEVVITFPAWIASLPDGEMEFLATDFSPFRHALAGARFETTASVDVPRALASAVGHIAAARYLAGERADAAELDANYVRRSDAEIFWKG